MFLLIFTVYLFDALQSLTRVVVSVYFPGSKSSTASMKACFQSQRRLLFEVTRLNLQFKGFYLLFPLGKYPETMVNHATAATSNNFEGKQSATPSTASIVH